MPTISSIKTGVSEIAKNYDVSKIYLFGSYAKGTARADSDIDFLFEKGGAISLLGVSSMLQDLREKFGVQVDLVSSDNLEKDFLDDVNSSKVLVYERQG